VAELLNSAFREDLEQLIQVHIELAAHGVFLELRGRSAVAAPAASHSGLADQLPPHHTASELASAAGQSPAADGATEATSGSLFAKIDARLARLEAALSEQVASQASELRTIRQLLQASFSLGLSLQEQQARTATALCALSQQLQQQPPHPSQPTAQRQQQQQRQQRHPHWHDVELEDEQQAERQSRPQPSQTRLQTRLDQLAAQMEQLLQMQACQQAALLRTPLKPEPLERSQARAQPQAAQSPSVSRSSSDGAAAAPSETAAPRRQARPVVAACSVCFDSPAVAVLYRCGHQCACLQCAYYMRQERLGCPLCRAPIEDVVRVYK